MSDEISRFWNTNVGMDMFTIKMAYDMTRSACYEVLHSIFLTNLAQSNIEQCGVPTGDSRGSGETDIDPVSQAQVGRTCRFRIWR